MPRADFYLIDKPRFREQPDLLVCELVRKAYAAEQPLLILAASTEQAEALDDLLWAFDEQAFIAHQIAGNDDDESVPVLIVPPGVEVENRTLLINLRSECAAGNFERVLEIVAADPAQRTASRARWKEYESKGFSVSKFDM